MTHTHKCIFSLSFFPLHIKKLIQSGSYCFFATHFMELTDLPTHYRQAANIHLTAEEEGETGKERLRFLHQISEGA